MTTELTAVQAAALDYEIGGTLAMIRQGLDILQHTDDHDRWEGAALLLATGLERLMKVVIALHRIQEEEPTVKRDMQNLGHNLADVFDEVTARQLWSAADAGLSADTVLQRLLRDVLLYCSGRARYGYLDAIVEPKQTLDSPERYFNQFETDVITEMGFDWNSLPNGDLDGATKRARIRIVESIQRLARAICRCFTLGGVKPIGARWTGRIAPFLFLRDEQLGTVSPPR